MDYKYTLSDTLHQKLKHLSNEDILNLIFEYFETDIKGKELAKKYNIENPPTKLQSLFPKRILEDKCPNCGNNMILPYGTRKHNSSSEPYCSNCKHMPNNTFCKCSFCKENIQVIIEKCYDLAQYTKIKFSDISFGCKVVLGTLLKHYYNFDEEMLEPLGDICTIFSPSEDYTYFAITHLLEKRLLVVSPKSSVSAFAKKENFPQTYYLYEVNFALNIDFENTYSIQDLLKLKNSDSDTEKANILWDKISSLEVMEYIEVQLSSLGKRIDISDFSDTQKISVHNMLDYYSASQICGIAYRALKNVALKMQQESMSKQHIINYFFWSMNSYYSKAIDNDWNLTQFNRDCKQSLLSNFFFNDVLQIGDLGFNLPPKL